MSGLIAAVFYVIVIAHDQEPVLLKAEMPLDECVAEVAAILSAQTTPSRRDAFAEGVEIRAGCIITLPRTFEH